MCGQVLAQVRVPAPEEVARTHDRERHRVLVAVGNPAGLSIALDAEEPKVGGDVEAVVGRVDAETMDVAEAGVLTGRCSRGGVLGAGSGEESGADEDGS